jgi:hypothetical protein
MSYLYSLNDLPNPNKYRSLSNHALCAKFGGYTKIIYNDDILVTIPNKLPNKPAQYNHSIIVGYSYDADDRPTGLSRAEVLECLQSMAYLEGASYNATIGGWLDGRGRMIVDAGYLIKLNPNTLPTNTGTRWKVLADMADKVRNAFNQNSVVLSGPHGKVVFIDGGNSNG